MIALSVIVETHPEFTEQYRDAVLRHAHNSITHEQGCLHFAVHEHVETPNRFFLYEAYVSREDLERVHQIAPYFQEFRELTAPWVKESRIERWSKVQRDA